FTHEMDGFDSFSVINCHRNGGGRGGEPHTGRGDASMDLLSENFAKKSFLSVGRTSVGTARASIKRATAGESQPGVEMKVSFPAASRSWSMACSSRAKDRSFFSRTTLKSMSSVSAP